MTPQGLRSSALAAAVVTLTLGLHSTVVAQVGSSTYRLSGAVVDYETARPVVGALVLARDISATTLTDDQGMFTIELPVGRPVTLELTQLGYRATAVTIKGPARQEMTTFTMAPDPIALAGVEVSVARRSLNRVLDQLDSRRRAHATRVLLIDRQRLARSAAPSAREVVQTIVPDARPCNVDAVGNLCIGHGDRARPPRVCIDGVRAAGGAADLRAFAPGELYLIEVYSRGRLIVAYSTAFMTRSLTRPSRVQPFPELEC